MCLSLFLNSKKKEKKKEKKERKNTHILITHSQLHHLQNPQIHNVQL